jgi:hypothetical protein
MVVCCVQDIFHKITPHPPPIGVGLSHKGRGKSSSVLIYSTTHPQGERGSRGAGLLIYIIGTCPKGGRGHFFSDTTALVREECFFIYL